MNNTISTIDRARSYLQKIPPAVAGQNGHAETFRAACALVQGFDLNVPVSVELLSGWNCQCDPPWSESDILHKVESANQAPSSNPRGYLLGDITPTITTAKSNRPDRSGFSRKTMDEVIALSEARPFGLVGLTLAWTRGHLVFGDWHGQSCYGVTDNSGRVLEIRRVDQKPLPAFKTLSERKSHAIRGSQKAWPIGIQEASKAGTIIILEGMPDFLEAHNLIAAESGERPELLETTFPVGMLSSSPAIHADALWYFQGKRIRIFPHAEKAEFKGGSKWKKQLLDAGAGKVDFFNFEGFKVNDLWEYARIGQMRRLLP